jgi:DNA gyrase subunit A
MASRDRPPDESPEAQLVRARERLAVIDAYVVALTRRAEVLQLAADAPTVEDARREIAALLDIRELHATAILDMQVRRLAVAERQKILDEQAELRAFISERGGADRP